MDNFSDKSDPRRISGNSVESEYAIEHPLIGKRFQDPDTARALVLFFESVMYLQDGNDWKASALLKEALVVDPSLH